MRGAWHPLRLLRRQLRRFRRDRRGTLAVEIAFAVPVLFGLTVSGVEVTRYVLLHQKIERTAATMADLTSQAEAVSETDLQSLFIAAQNVMTPYDLATAGRVVLSSIYHAPGGSTTIVWQRGYGAGSGASHFGAEGAAPTLPTDMVVRDGEDVIVAEVFYDYQPLLAGSVMSGSKVYNFAAFRPRFGALLNVKP